jgi:peptide/nickel transport system permease protein
MNRYIISRILQAFILLLFVSIIMFTILTLAPGGPAILLQQEISDELAARLRQQMGLDQPPHIQYVRWITRFLQGDLGTSFSYARPVSDIIRQRFVPTLVLGSASLTIAVVFGVLLGITSALNRYSFIDYLATGVAFFGLSIPVFWFGIMLIIIFSVTLGWLPSGGMYGTDGSRSLLNLLRHLIMPAIVLGTPSMAQLARFTRSSMITAMREDYIRTARSKGVGENRVLWNHAFKNGLIPVLTILGIIVPRLFSGAAITESVFAWPGLGRLAVESAFQRDYPVIMALTILVSAMVIVSNLIVDLLYVVIDPRIRYQ